jgi:radical SAM protein with 4Fe4S-binding SPASM domain
MRLAISLPRGINVIKRLKDYTGKGNTVSYYLRRGWPYVSKKLSALRILNILFAVCEWKLHKIASRALPFIVRLEPSAVCNLKCPSCKTTKKALESTRVTYMSLADFSAIFASVSHGVWRCTFYIAGEPLMNPDLFAMVRIANRNKSFTSLSTNFTLMNSRRIDSLFRSGLDWLSVCLDGFSQKVYEQYRVNGDVTKVKKSIEMVMKYKNEHRLRYPFLNVHTIVFDHVKPEVKQIMDFCSRLKVDRLTLKPDEFKCSIVKRPYKNCFWPWFSLSIDCDGSVYPCDVAFSQDRRKPYGNLLNQDLKEIWNGELFMETRRFLSGRSKRNVHSELPCHSCWRFGSP